MADRAAGHPISKKSLEAHLSKVDGHLESINRGRNFPESLFNLVNDLGSTKIAPPEVSGTMDHVRMGFALYYQMSAMLEDRMKEVDGKVTEAQKLEFRNSYSSFAAGAYIANQISLMLADKEPHEFDRKSANFDFTLTKDDTLNGILMRLYGLINSAKRQDVFTEGIEFPKTLQDFLVALQEKAIECKTKFDPKLVALVKDSQFTVDDKFTINGYEAASAAKKSAKVEFVPVLPHQVAGNTRAKTEMLRDMDRMALYDLLVKRNPIMEVGGLSWSILYDGFPGTGKSTLFRMGLSRLDQRCKQASEFWKSKNLPGLKWTQLIVDQSVKNEYYGKTGQNVIEKLEQLKKDDGIYILTMDDIDLLVGDRGSKSGGGDNDILNVLMQAADGINTIIRGNAQWWAATNDATAMDPALRQRFVARYPVDGPEKWFDFADILYDKTKIWIDSGILALPTGDGYTPFKMREGETGYEKPEEKSSGGLLSGMNKFMSKISGKKVTLRDIGEFCREKHDQNPRFTGRAVNAVAEALKKRINDYDIPGDWYEKPDTFFAKPYEERVSMLRALSKPVTGEMVIEEIERYASSEQRYASDKFESDVKKRLNDYKVDAETRKRF